MKLSDINTIIESRENLRPIAVVKPLGGGKHQLFSADSLDRDDDLQKVIWEAFQKDRSCITEFNGEKLFIHVFNSPLRLIIVGAVHIAKHLIQLAQMCGYDVVLIDPRRAFSKSKYLASVNTVTEWPDQSIQKLETGIRTAIVTLTHDPKLDEPALIAAIRSEAFYIGALGSRRTHRARCQRLKDSGISDDQLKRIHAPVGLDIGAQSPAEIAVSIMAEITEILRRLQES